MNTRELRQQLRDIEKKICFHDSEIDLHKSAIKTLKLKRKRIMKELEAQEDLNG